MNIIERRTESFGPEHRRRRGQTAEWQALFERMLERVRTSTGAERANEKPFYRGLYGGLMRDPRKEAIPKPATPKKRPRRQGKAAAATPLRQGHVRQRAYEVACALGEEIHLNHPLERVMESLETVLQVEGRHES